MERDVLAGIRDVLSTSRILSLAAIIDGEPEAALLPFVASEPFAALYVQASGLARHSRALMPGAQVGVLVHRPDAPDAAPMQLPRLTVQAVVTVLERETEEFAAAAERFTARFPAARMTLALGDFNLYALTLGRGRYVEGFARAFNVGSHTFQEVARL